MELNAPAQAFRSEESQERLYAGRQIVLSHYLRLEVTMKFDLVISCGQAREPRT